LELADRVKANPGGIHKIIIVDDASKNGTRDILKKIDDALIKVIGHTHNQGKGAALRSGF
jgi:glycosyltransferase involved in cell wall biosynthesis